MDKILKHLMLLFVATFSLTLASCGGDEPDEPGNPSGGSSFEVTKGSASDHTWVALTEHEYEGPIFVWGTNTNIYLRSSMTLSSVYSHVSMASVGIVSGLDKIKTAPADGWTQPADGSYYPQLPLEDNGGYVITYTYEGKPHYIRLFITLNRIVTGETVGINYQFQEFVPTNL